MLVMLERKNIYLGFISITLFIAMILLGLLQTNLVYESAWCYLWIMFILRVVEIIAYWVFLLFLEQNLKKLLCKNNRNTPTQSTE